MAHNNGSRVRCNHRSCKHSAVPKFPCIPFVSYPTPACKYVLSTLCDFYQLASPLHHCVKMIRAFTQCLYRSQTRIVNQLSESE